MNKDFTFNTSAPLHIIDIKIMQGANYFSGGNVVVMLLDLKEYDEVFTNSIPKFYQKLSAKLPSLIEHHCSVGKRGGFFIRVKEGTLLGHVVEHIAIELQTLAGMDVGFGKTRESTKKGIYNVVVRYFDEQAGIFALKAAVGLVNSILTDTEFDVDGIVKKLVEIREARLLGPSTQAIINEIKKRRIPYFRLDEYNLVQLGTGKYQKKIRATLTSETNFIAVETADDKFLTYKYLKDAGLPTPETFIYHKKGKIDFNKFVIKPRFGNLGKGITIFTEKNNLPQAINYAKEYSNDVLLQNFIEGHTYRLLTIDYKFVAATRIDPPIIKGDGKHTVEELIEHLNSNPQRGYGDKTPLTEMKIDKQTERIFKMENISLATVLEKDREIALKISPNLNLGGTSIDVTDVVHPDNIFAAERASEYLGLNVAGIDIIAKDIRQSIFETNGAIIEVNAAPDFRMHLMPMAGKKRDVAKPLVEMLFKKEKPNHIPLIAITGSKGKSRAVKIIEKGLMLSGYNVGSFAKSHVRIKDFPISTDNPFNAVRAILKDPTIDFCVAEIPLQTILNDGLAYQFADMGVVLNVQDVYSDLDSYVYIRDLEDVAYAKSVVAEEVYKNGWTILNAEDTNVYRMKKRIWSNLLLFAEEKTNALKYNISKGGISVFTRYGKIVLAKREDIIEIAEKPIDFDEFKDSYLASVAVLYLLGIETEIIRKSLL